MKNPPIATTIVIIVTGLIARDDLPAACLFACIAYNFITHPRPKLSQTVGMVLLTPINISIISASIMAAITKKIGRQITLTSPLLPSKNPEEAISYFTQVHNSWWYSLHHPLSKLIAPLSRENQSVIKHPKNVPQEHITKLIVLFRGNSEDLHSMRHFHVDTLNTALLIMPQPASKEDGKNLQLAMLTKALQQYPNTTHIDMRGHSLGAAQLLHLISTPETLHMLQQPSVQRLEITLLGGFQSVMNFFRPCQPPCETAFAPYFWGFIPSAWWHWRYDNVEALTSLINQIHAIPKHLAITLKEHYCAELRDETLGLNTGIIPALPAETLQTAQKNFTCFSQPSMQSHCDIRDTFFAGLTLPKNKRDSKPLPKTWLRDPKETPVPTKKTSY